MKFRPFAIHSEALLLAIHELRNADPGTRMTVKGGTFNDGAFEPRDTWLELALVSNAYGDEGIEFNVYIGEEPPR
jgi:hypothetical protein